MTFPTKKYHDGLYGPTTPLALIECLEVQVGTSYDPLAYHRAQKVTIQYGNPTTGRTWGDLPVTGFLALTGTETPTVVLKTTPKSKTGTPVLLGNIVRITSARTVLYRHPTFHIHIDTPPVVEETHDNADRALRRVAFRNNDSDSSNPSTDDAGKA
jgi:hypothetical protein